MSELYVITGASGNTGKRIASSLLGGGKRVRVQSRSEAHLSGLIDMGAESATGDLTDAEFVSELIKGASAVYALIPSNFSASDYRSFQNRVADAFAAALETHRVPYVVLLSSVGAHLSSGAGVVLGLHDAEQKFNRLEATNVIHLRPTYFMENLLGQIGVIQAMGFMGSPIKADMPFPMVVTQDIADMATAILNDLNFRGKSVRYVLGPEDVTLNRVARVIGDAIGKPDLKYQEVSATDTRNVFISQMGMGESAADLMLEFIEGMNDGRVFSEVERNSDNTTTTSIENFAAFFKQVYQNS